MAADTGQLVAALGAAFAEGTFRSVTEALGEVTVVVRDVVELVGVEDSLDHLTREGQRHGAGGGDGHGGPHSAGGWATGSG